MLDPFRASAFLPRRVGWDGREVNGWWLRRVAPPAPIVFWIATGTSIGHVIGVFTHLSSLRLARAAGGLSWNVPANLMVRFTGMIFVPADGVYRGFVERHRASVIIVNQRLKASHVLIVL